MKLFALAMATLGLAALSGAQASKARVDAIWNIANDRLSSQLDIWFEDGEFPTCIQLLKVQLELYPNDYDVATNLGWMEENIQRWDEAIATYSRYRDENPQDPDAPLALADFYFRQKVYTKIPALLEPAIPRKPHPNAYRILAHSYEKMKMYTDAKRVWDTYIEVAPSDLTAKVNREKIVKKLSGK